jgi:hypothetical protein
MYACAHRERKRQREKLATPAVTTRNKIKLIN